MIFLIRGEAFIGDKGRSIVDHEPWPLVGDKGANMVKYTGKILYYTEIIIFFGQTP